MNQPAILSVSDAVFALEPLATLREDGLEAMLYAHWKEVAHDKDVIALDPDWERYDQMERNGDFVAFGLRKDGELIGYTAFFINRALHNRAHIFALNDVIYIQPKHRGLDGLVLILESERALRKLAVSKVFYHTKTDSLLGDADGDSLGALERLMDLEEVYGVKMPDDLPLEGSTLGEVLGAVGYGLVEHSYGKLLLTRG